MHCGGYVEVYIEPISSTKKLFIFGAGHVGKAVAKFASQFGFNITVFDERPEIFNDLTEKEIEKIDMPIGIKFNAQTPEEIAVSIVAKLIDIKNSSEL